MESRITQTHLARQRRVAAKKLSSHWNRHVPVWRARLLTEWWSVGVADRSLADIARTGSLGPVRWMEEQAGRSYLADPFAWTENGEALCEEKPRGRPGRILRLVPCADGRLCRGGPLMEGPAHLSYPCILKHEGASWLTVEDLSTDVTPVWRLRSDGARTLAGEAARGFRLADPTLFHADGIFWLAGTDVAIGLHDNLCLYHAPAAEGPWTAHRLNPVKRGVSSSRPAGAPFQAEGRLIRPAQDCVATYVAAVVLCEVLTLTPQQFEERPLHRIAPDPHGPFPHGLHTLSAFGERTLVDGKRLVLSPSALAAKAVRRIGLSS